MRFLVVSFMSLFWTWFAHGQSVYIDDLSLTSSKAPEGELELAEQITKVGNSWTDPVFSLTWVYIGEYAYQDANRECIESGYSFPSYNATKITGPVMQSLLKALPDSPLIEVIPETSPETQEIIRGDHVTRRAWIENPAMLKFYSEMFEEVLEAEGYPEPALMRAYAYVGGTITGQGVWCQSFWLKNTIMSTLCLK